MKRTNISIDEQKIRRIQNFTGERTMKQVVDIALQHFEQELLRRKKGQKILSFQGSGVWKGSLKKMRKARLEGFFL